MFFDLNVPVPALAQPVGHAQSRKSKGKQPQQPTTTVAPPVLHFNAAQVSVLEARIDLLEHLGYTAIAFSQTVYKKVDSKSHVNVLDGLLSQLRTRTGIVYMKRLTIVLDEDSEKGFGLTNANAPLFGPYDLIALVPTTFATFSLACLSHTTPSPITAHIVSLPLTLPRLPFHLKHTLVRTAIKNGAVFEINYGGAIGGEPDPEMVNGGAAGTGDAAKRNWWAGAREVVRVAKGKGILVSGGITNDADYRAPRDIGNLITLLGLPQDGAHAASTTTPKSLALRAQTRRTYRAVFSEPTVVIPEAGDVPMDTTGDSREPTLAGQKRPHSDEISAVLSAGDSTNTPNDTSGGQRKKKKKTKAQPEA